MPTSSRRPAERWQQDMSDKKEIVEAICGIENCFPSGTARMTDEIASDRKAKLKGGKTMKDKLQTVPDYLAKLLKIEEDLIAATVKHWQEHMRDKEGRAIPVDEKLIEHAAGVVVSTGPTKATPEDVIDEAAVLRWSIEDDLNQYGEHKRAVIRRQLEGLEAICRLEYHARAGGEHQADSDPAGAKSLAGIEMAATIGDGSNDEETECPNLTSSGVAQICDLLRSIAEVDAILVRRQDDHGPYNA